jgi:hypothetical protein
MGRDWLPDLKVRIRDSSGLVVEARWQALAALACFCYVLSFRAHGISDALWFRGDQVRDWALALGPFGDLPRSGVPSTAGGTTLGPVYYWFLWLVARIAHPLIGSLPHAGGFAVAALQSTADAVLLLALFRRLQSPLLAMVIVVAAATCGYDATLSSTIWNPPVAAACAKLAIAVVLWNRDLTIARIVLATIASWIAVQCHTSGFIVAIPVLAWLFAAPAWARDWGAVGISAGVVATIVLLLQVPLLTSRHEEQTAPRRITSSIATVLSDPINTVHVGASSIFVARVLHFNLVRPFDENQKTLPLFAAALVGASIATIALTRDAALLVVSIGPLLTAVALFAFWQGPLDEVYWSLVLIPAAGVALFAWIDRIGTRAGAVLVTALALVLTATQPARAQMAWSFLRWPQYGAIVKACQSIASRSVEVRGMQTTFEVPPDAKPEWLCTLAGATIRSNESAPLAIVDPSSAVSYR